MCSRGNLLKQNATVLVCVNPNETERKNLLVVGKSKYPWCFKYVKNFSVIYQSNKVAWWRPILLRQN